jgi:hypothetical protein
VNVNKRNPTSENTALHVAALSGSTACVNALLGFGAEKDITNKQVIAPNWY